MNHFFLWIGPDSPTAKAGQTLMGYCKDIADVSTVRHPHWSIVYAAQKDGLGAFRDDRRRSSGTGDQQRDLFWFGHAWSRTDGAQPAFSVGSELHGVACVKAIREQTDGVYALVLLDRTRNEAVVACDMLGSFHVYHRVFSDGVAISNSSALLASLPPAAGLDPLGVQEFCSHAVANEDRSIWSEVRKLRGAHLLRVDAGRPVVDLVPHRPILSALADLRDYETDPLPGLSRKISDALTMIDRPGARGAEFRDLPWVADLTGGNDSRALMAAIVANHINVVSTVSGPPSDPDVQIGERLAKKIGIRHYTRPRLGPLTRAQFEDSLKLTDGEFDAVEYAGVAAVHRQHAADGLQFSVNGSYGEVARGHAWRLGLPGMLFPDFMADQLKRRTPLTLDHPSIGRWQQVFSLKAPPPLFSPAARATSVNYFPGLFERLQSYAGELPQHAQLDLIHIDLRVEKWQGRLLSSTNQLWPALSPWGFHEPHWHILLSAPRARRNGLLTRAYTAAQAPALANEPLYTGNPALPFTLGNAHRFLPVVAYFADRARNKLMPPPAGTDAPAACIRQPTLCADGEIRGWLAEPMLASTGVFDKDVLLATLAPERPQSDGAHQLWCRLLTLEAALRRQAKAQEACAQ